MRTAALYSALLHCGILLFLVFDWYNPFVKHPLAQQPLMVEVTEIREVSSAPQLGPVPHTAKIEAAHQSSTSPTQPAPQHPLPLTKPEKTLKDGPTEHGPKPRAAKEIKEVKREKKTAPSTPSKAEINLNKKAAIKAPPDQSLDQLLSEMDLDSSGSNQVSQGLPASKVDSVISASEADALRRKLYKCWLVPAGARGAKDLIVDIDMEVRQDGTVAKAVIVDKARYNNDSVFRAAADSARRAVLDPQCNPLPLPLEKYHQWRNLTVSFNPKDMF